MTKCIWSSLLTYLVKGGEGETEHNPKTGLQE